MLIHSIRWRLQLWLAFLLILLLSGFGTAVYQLQRTTLYDQLDEQLERRVVVLNQAVRGGTPPEGRRPPPPDTNDDLGRFDRPPGKPPRFGPPPDGPGPGRGPGGRNERRDIRLSTEQEELFGQGLNEGFYYSVWSRDGTLLRRSGSAPQPLELPARPQRDTSPHNRTREDFREAYQFTELGDCVLAGRSLGPMSKSLSTLAWTLLAAGGAMLALGMGGGWWLASSAMRPVEQISAAARRIAAGQLSERIPSTQAGNELGRLADVLNDTFARLEGAFLRQKQFTADASHELRTPIAVLISEAQTTLSRERSRDEYRETIEANLAIAQQMRRLTESLLTLARLEAGHEEMRSSPFDLRLAVQLAVERIRPLASARGIALSLALDSVKCRGDADRLGQVITNLLSNAIHYNREGGQVCITARVEAGMGIVTVSDTGQGIGPEDLPHIYERFYRADKARSRAEGHAGLGLAITKAIIEAQGGSIEVESQPGVGTTFTVRLQNCRSGSPTLAR